MSLIPDPIKGLNDLKIQIPVCLPVCQAVCLWILFFLKVFENKHITPFLDPFPGSVTHFTSYEGECSNIVGPLFCHYSELKYVHLFNLFSEIVTCFMLNFSVLKLQLNLLH